MRGERLDRDATTLFALEQYRSLKKPNGDPFYYHPRKVAKIAEFLVLRDRKVRAPGSFLMPAELQAIEEAWHAGWLHDSMSKGAATFDDIVHLTNIQVAQWVSGLSDDNRLPGPRRIAAYANQLQSQPNEVKIIKLADMGHSLDELIEFLKKETDPEVDREEPIDVKGTVGIWPEEVVRILEAIESVKAVSLVDEFLWCERAASALARCAKKPAEANEIVGGISACPIKPPKKKRRRRRRSRSG
jgi:hypothetical protein